jgi:rhodanese-related sulfurtransferase
MRTRALVASVIVALSCAVALAGQTTKDVPRITIDEVKKLMAGKRVVLIDVRDPQSFSEGHIPGAINVPFDHLPNHVDEWKKDKRLLVTYCA